MSKEERKIVSYHEVGHALISALQKNSEPVQKITIVPRTMGALGYVMHVPEEEKYLDTEAELRDRLVGLLGGRAAEEIVFDTVTTGAANDIEQATSIARNMITRFGMSKKFGLMGLATVESQYLEGRASLTCSDVTAADIDTEVMKMLRDSYKQAKKLLKENREIMDKLAAYLIEKETITGKEFMKIFRKEKGIPEPEENEAEGEKGAQAQTEEAPKAETPTVQQPQQQPILQPWGQQPMPQQQSVQQQPQSMPNQQWTQQSVPGQQWVSPYQQPMSQSQQPMQQQSPSMLNQQWTQQSAPGQQWVSPYQQPISQQQQMEPYSQQVETHSQQPILQQQQSVMNQESAPETPQQPEMHDSNNEN